jgi:hypothetical protein
VEWNTEDKFYRIYGSREGLYRISFSHPDYSGFSLDSVKVTKGEGHNNCVVLKTRTLRILVAPKTDSTAWDGQPFRIKESLAEPRC